ncbi:MAG: Crp/Fnr family transcriptional regulator [Gemmataceae bacterium]|nr:Crp/Fnr family transcriptional regulator [Gemmataceae bacterium]
MNTETMIRMNRLLAGLSGRPLKSMRAILKPVQLGLGEVLCRPRAEITHVYFPAKGVISVVVNMADGSAAEAGMIGNEGVLGLCVALGSGSSPFEAVVQEPMVGLRATAVDFSTVVSRSVPLRNQLYRYIDVFITMISQSAACNRLHTAPQRLCRWLLMTHDRAAADEFQITQQFLGRMLGVRRMSIIPPARKLQELGLIKYSRGRIRVLDRAGLEANACECYAVVRARLDVLLP